MPFIGDSVPNSLSPLSMQCQSKFDGSKSVKLPSHCAIHHDLSLRQQSPRWSACQTRALLSTALSPQSRTAHRDPDQFSLDSSHCGTRAVHGLEMCGRKRKFLCTIYGEANARIKKIV